MAYKNQIDPAAASRGLGRWLQTKIPGATAVEVTDVRVPSESGLSCETVMFNASWQHDGAQQRREFVARVAPAPGTDALFTSYDLELEAKIMSALRERGIPTPQVLFADDDPAVFPGPFIVMEAIAGRVLADDPPYTVAGWFLDLPGEQRTQLVNNSVDLLARIHAEDWEEMGLHGLDHPELGSRGVGQRIGFIERLYEASSGGTPHFILDEGLAWLRANKPADEGPMVVNWGDARFGNILFDGVEPVGVLDWELATLGSREQELGFVAFSWDLFTTGVGAPWPEGFPTEAEAVARYQAQSGHEVGDLTYYKVLASLLSVATLLRLGSLMIKAGMMPADSPMPHNNPATVMARQYLGLPAAGVGSVGWAGHRD